MDDKNKQDADTKIPIFLEYTTYDEIIKILTGTWVGNATKQIPKITPPLNSSFIIMPRVYNLYLDCYHSLLIGRHTASIILMGVLLEALMKERIELKLGVYLEGSKGTYEQCLRVIEKDKLMDDNDLKFLRDFKEKIRNPHQHSDEKKIAEGVSVGVLAVRLDAKDMEKAAKEVTSGVLKFDQQPASELPPLRQFAQQEVDQELAIPLFNDVCSFLIRAKNKYFKQEDWEEYHKKYAPSWLNRVQIYDASALQNPEK